MSPAPEELQQLLRACSRRDRDAFAQLYRATAPKLYGVALRILRREDWAEEVLQDCYVSIWTHATSYSAARAAPLTWMTSIVRNRCLDWLRRPRPEVTLESGDSDEGDPLDGIASDMPEPLQQLSAMSEGRALHTCLQTLDAKQRQAILLAFFDGLSHSELAAHLHQPLGTVKTWVRRGLERLRNCLTQGQQR